MKTIYIREAPKDWDIKVMKILGKRLSNNGKKFTKNDAYLDIFERGLNELSKEK